MNVEIWILIAVLFLGGVQLISVGILGRYLARVHEQTLERPLYLVARVVGPATRPQVENAVLGIEPRTDTAAFPRA